MSESTPFSWRGRELPLGLWLLGYLEFLWHTLGPGLLPLGAISCAGILVLAFFTARARIRAWRDDLRSLKENFRREYLDDPWVTCAYGAAFALLAASLTLGLYSALRPPHLPQEYDAVHYQMGIPAQLLLRHGLGWIDWSVADLWPMAMQWGMAPLSVAFATVNKIPQFIFTLGVASCLYRLPSQLGVGERRRKLVYTVPMLLLLGAHGVAIQLGTGMMDLPALYLLLLTLSALLDRRWVVAAASLAIYTSSKAFHPFQIAPVIVGGLVWLHWTKPAAVARPVYTRFLSIFVLLTLLLTARSGIQSWQATGTPLFPFGACTWKEASLCTDANAEKVFGSASALVATRYNYGNGRGPLAFAMHLWRVAVPSVGVNNEFDYPLGLPWLLLLVLLAFKLRREGAKSPLLWLTVLFWALWWMNSHQSRWLYPVMAFGLLATLGQQARAHRVLPFLILISSGLSLVSQARAMQPTWNMSAREIQSKEEAKARWRDERTLESLEMLYLKKPAWDHTGGEKLWVLR